jgi:hypothetical protein
MDKEFYIIVMFFQVVRSLILFETRNERQLSVTVQGSNDYQCPPWFFYNTAAEQCEYYSNPNTEDIVKCSCNERAALVKYGYCMTYSDGGTFVGKCQYFEIQGHNSSDTPGYITLPGNISELNEYMCGPMNRKGLVCSECKEGFGPSVTSLGYRCFKCAWYGIPLYLFLDFVPITVFYVVIILFQINLTSAPFTAFILGSQFTVSGFMAAFGRYSFLTNTEYYLFIIPITFYGIFNLDFLRFILPPFCVSSHLNIIGITFLGYISAFYPLCLIALMWMCRSYDFKIINWCEKTFNIRYFSKLPLYVNKERNTTIDVFSTFLLLSYTKLVVIFVAVIEPDVIFNVDNQFNRNVLSSDPSIEWFSVHSLPYLIVSFIIFLVLILPPIILLAFYPTKLFQLLLSLCSSGGRSRALLALNTFVDKFYSSYRDGLSGGRDLRGFASLYFLLRIIIYLSSITEHFLSYSALILGATGFLIAIVRPYKKTYMNVIDTLILANLALVSMLVNMSRQEPLGSKGAAAHLGIAIIACSFPLIGFLTFCLCKITPFRRLLVQVKQKIKVCSCPLSLCNDGSNRHIENVCRNNSDDSDLPDRVLNYNDYNDGGL